MNFERIFASPFEDPDWPRKVAIGGLAGILSLALVGIFLILGYLRRFAAAILEGQPITLPEWEDFEGDLVEGLRLFGILVIYLTPVFFLAAALLPAAALAASFAGPERFTLPVLLALIGLLVPGVVLVAFVLPAAFLLYVKSGEFGVAFRFSEVFGLIRDHLTRYTTAFVVSLALVFVASFGGFFCFVGIVFSGFVAAALATACFAEAIRPEPGSTSD